MTIRFSMQDGTVEVAQYQKVPIYLHPAFFVTAAILGLAVLAHVKPPRSHWQCSLSQ